MSKNHSMIFDADSIRAFMAGAKTQTRRVVKPQPWPQAIVAVNSGYVCVTEPGEDAAWTVYPRYAPGDVVYVKETWCEYGRGKAIYRADYGLYSPISDGIGGPWRSPMFMPRWAARLWLRVVDVRVERVQDISEVDADAEGCPYREYSCRSAKGWFAARWDAINAKRYPWASNPWVFAYTLERIEKP